DAHLVLVLADPIARSARLDDECRNAARAAPGLRDREDRVVRGDGAFGVPFLLAVDDVVVAVLLRFRDHRARIGPGVFFRETERDQLVARSDAGEPTALLLVGATEQ